MSAMTLVTKSYLLFSVSVLLLDVHVDCFQRELNINLKIVHTWADHFEKRLLDIAETATGVGYFEHQYDQRKTENIVSNKNRINETLESVRGQLKRVLKDKEKAVQNMMMAAEKANEEYGAYKKPEQLDPEDIQYYNAKKIVSDMNIDQMSQEMKEDIKKTINYLPLDTTTEEFNYNHVNLNVSTIHVPTNIYDKSTKILNGVSWSENITSQFVENTKMDHTLTWQYFCSSDGFFRIYPGIIWPRDPDKVDMFDCRVRNWYIQAATTPKNIVILMDASGSMKGLRMEIARNTVDKILDTLSNDDYFNILEFSEEVSYVDECFNRTLMQASVNNVRRMQEEIKNVGTFKMANFQKALVEAFTLFETVEEDLDGTLCNKAIMLVTDGAPENYEETFEKYNWPNKTIRVFTYLIGKEVSDNRQVRWMACANKGDHKHISTRADVQENVQQYIKVLSRPMVQNGYHNLVWTAAYLDYVTEQSPMSESVASPFYTSQSDLVMNRPGDHNKGLGLMITAAMPVFDRRKLMEDEEEVIDSEYSGNLLGVVGTDVRTFDIKKHIPLHKLGVNGYAFAITNHGYIIFHPDFRPLYQKNKKSSDLSLKPNYNSVDLTEVELADDIDILKELRRTMLDTTHSSMEMNVTVHYDDMQRFRRRRNSYYFKKVSNVFSLAFVIPKGYGENTISLRYHRQKEDADYILDIMVFLAPWIFCRNISNNNLIALDKMELYYIVKQESIVRLKCDEDIIKKLTYDAKETFQLKQLWEGEQDFQPRNRLHSTIKTHYEACFKQSNKLACYKKTFQKFGIEILFVGTSVGLTRMMATTNITDLTDSEFATESIKTIEEPYYKRAVDGWQDGYNFTFHLRQSSLATTFDPNTSTVIMSTPTVLSERGRVAVTSVIGFQMKYTKFNSIFEEFTLNCPEGEVCNFTCNDTDYLNCYLLDQSGFVMASNNKDGNDTGKFFGLVDSALMKEFQTEKIYDSKSITDYQGVCQVYSSDQDSSAARLLNPLMKIFTSLLWGMSEFIIFFSQWSFYSVTTLFQMVKGYDYEDAINNKDPMVRFYFSLVVDATTQEDVLDDHIVDQKACDKKVTLYNLNVSTLKKENGNSLVNSITGCGECRLNTNGLLLSWTNRTYIVRWIKNTNLILVVAAANCSCGDGEDITLTQEKITYDDIDKCKRVGKVTHPQQKTPCYDSSKETGSRCCGSSSRSSLLLLTILMLKAMLS